MKKIIKTKDIELSEAMEDYIDKKLGTLNKFVVDVNEDLVMAQVELLRTTRHHQTGDIFRAEINLSIDGKLFRVESEKDDIYAALDDVRDGLEQEIKKYKNKRETIFLRGARSIKKRFGISPQARFRNK